MKKLLSVLLCVLMLASIAIVPAAAADEAASEPNFYFLANGVPVADNVFAPEAGYADTTITLNTGDMPENYGYDVYFNAAKSSPLTPVFSPVEEAWLLGRDYSLSNGTRIDSATVLTIPADLPYGTYVATFTLRGNEEYEPGKYNPLPEKDITITINIPCDHANAIYQGGSSAGLFTQGFTGVHYCPDCETVLSLGDVIPSGIETSALGQLFSGFSSLGLTLRNTIVGLMKFISVD